uniref:RING-type domain-containing protein n=2 Tax=Kalmanozyma brasiliensis (strain GHG001) TaxID=1365824 RepID=V5EKV2_KALBG
MTKCGHVFCYPCILHYLTLKEDDKSKPGPPTLQPSTQKWRRCPICWDAVYARDLKAVRWWDAQAAARQHEAKLQEQYDLERVQRISELDEDSHDVTESALRDENAPSLTHSHPDMLALRLVERPNVTTLALPQSSTWPASELDHPLIAVHSAPWHFQPDVMGFAKFMLATPELLTESLEKDLQELLEEIDVLKSFGTDASGLHFVALAQQKVNDQMQKVRDELDLPIVRSTIGQAHNDLKDHKAALSGQLQRTDLSRRQRKRMERSQTDEEEVTAAVVRMDVSSARDGTPEAASGAEEFLAFRAQSQGGIMGIASTDGGATRHKDDAAPQSVATDATHKAAQSRPPKARKNVNPPQPESSSYVFFQAASGQSIFLHPLDTKILLSHYGAYAKLPRNLAVKVAGADEGSMNEELRRRCKYLNHIPMAADVVFIEVDWEDMNLISKSTLRPYEQALRQRRNRRRDKERREDRAKTRAEEAELISNQGGPAAAAAHRRQQEQLAAFTSEANFPSDGLSRSFERGGSAGEGGFASGSSPSFRESAMFGAERSFPVHPGAAETEDFPDSLHGARSGLDHAAVSSDDQADRSEQNGARKPAQASAPMKKTVWGTPASASSFSNAIQGRATDAHGIWDDHMEDAWHELEEDYILGSTGSGRRPTGAVREGRGLNKQIRPSGVKPPANVGAKESLPAAKSETQAEAGTAAETPAADNGGARSKRVKKKLILTGGGGGRGSR